MALCPICQHALPEATHGLCPNCGAESGGVASSPAGPPPAPSVTTPWEARERIGLVAALAETTREVLTAPSRFFRAMPVTGGPGSPLLYALLLGWFGVLVAGFYQVLWDSLAGARLSPLLADNPELARLVGWTQGWAGFAWQAVFGGLAVLLGVLLWSGVVHLLLLAFGGGRRGLEATLRVIAFTQATSVLALLPFCGAPVAWLWSLVVQVIGLSEAHGIGRGKAAAAVLLPLALVCCCCGALIGVALAGAFSLVGRLQ